MVPVDVAFALAFGLVVLAASLLGMWATRRERTPNEPCSGGDGRGGTRASDAEQGEKRRCTADRAGGRCGAE